MKLPQKHKKQGTFSKDECRQGSDDSSVLDRSIVKIYCWPSVFIDVQQSNATASHAFCHKSGLPLVGLVALLI